MVKSLCSKYKDIVAMIPVAKLTAQKQLKYLNKILQLLNSVGFSIVAVSLDSTTCNRKLYIDGLCNGQLSTSIVNPATGQPLFLIFDPVHRVKKCV